MSHTIALVDDDRNILTSISMALENENFKVQTYIDGESALIGISRNPPDLAVIDIKMPRMDGEELLKRLRKKTAIPILFLTSKDEEVDELLGLKLGADDFIKKSGGFSIKVLIERIRVQLRKKITSIDETKNLIKHGKLRLDPSQLECEWDGKTLPDKLTTTEFIRGLRSWFHPWDAWFGLIKGLFVGIAITSISCYQGYYTSGGANGVGKSTTAAVVVSCIAIFFLDYILSALLL